MDGRPRNIFKTMENQTSFDLNLAIQRWRENLAQSAAFRTENLNELESHLRDSVAKLETGHLSAEEAFLIASRRIGAGQRLELEFGKLNRNIIWLDHLLWMLIGVQAWIFVTLLSSIPANLMAFGWSHTNYHWRDQGLTFPVVLFVMVRVLSLGASFWFLWWLIFRKGNKFGRWLLPKMQQRRSVVGYTVAVCLLLLALQVLSTGVPIYLGWRFGPATVVETGEYLNLSRIFVSPALILVLVVFTLLLVRKRAILESK